MGLAIIGLGCDIQNIINAKSSLTKYYIGLVRGKWMTRNRLPKYLSVADIEQKMASDK